MLAVRIKAPKQINPHKIPKAMLMLVAILLALGLARLSTKNSGKMDRLT